jgi:hypothetical protein
MTYILGVDEWVEIAEDIGNAMCRYGWQSLKMATFFGPSRGFDINQKNCSRPKEIVVFLEYITRRCTCLSPAVRNGMLSRCISTQTVLKHSADRRTRDTLGQFRDRLLGRHFQERNQHL